MKTLIKERLFAGKFEIQGEIAKGQTGTILYGYDLGLRQEVAIKVYHSHINGRLIQGKAFVEKSKPLLLLDHPNLIKIFKVEEEEDTPVIFMEFFDAPSLQQMIHDKGPMPVQDMLILAREITDVLVHTHFQGIIHGTLHPGHVLVGPQGKIKVMDLGLSWILMDILSNCDVELLRPLPYLLPEIAKGELLDVSSDLYCLGFMMYEMLTGTVPYAGLPKTSIIGKLTFDQSDPVFEFPDSIPEVICDLIRQMTRNKAQQRLQDSTHVLTIINQQLTKLPLSEKSVFLPPQVHQSQAPSPQAQTEPKPTEPKESSKASAPSTTPEPPFKRIPQIQRPQASMDYGRVKQNKILRKVGLLLILILLVGVAGALGYWYRDFLEPHFSILQEQPDMSPQGTSLPQTMPIESETPIAPAQDSLNIQEPLSGTDEHPQTEISPLAPPQKPTPSKMTPAVPKIVPLSSTEASKKTPVQQSISQKPTVNNNMPGQPLVPTQKQPVSNLSITPKVTPTVPRITPVPATKTIKKKPLQKSKSQQPKPKAKQTQSLVPAKNQPASIPSPAPVVPRPSKMTPPVPEIVPLATTKATKKESLKGSASLQPIKEVIPVKKESTQSATVSEEMNREPIAEEIQELLQTLDAAKEDLSSITEPESLRKP